jgi:polyisoprenoid-binding protein YceI
MALIGLSRVSMALVAALWTTNAVAEIKEYKIDRTHSFIGFEISHWGFSQTVGRFNDYGGRVVVDEDNPTRSTINVTITARSVDTGFEPRDEFVRRAEFLDVAKFPTMTFKSTKVEIVADRRSGRLTGELTLRGVTRPVTFDFAVTRIGNAPHPDYKNVAMAGFRASAQIKRSDFGMTFATPAVGDAVDLTFHLEIVHCVGESAQAPSCTLSY